MEAIYKRELKGFFTNPVGYVFIAVMLAFEGFSFWQMMYYQSTQYFSVIYDNIFSFGMMLIPILTMKLFSEEKKQKTDQALLTAPVSLTGLVMGKFMAAVTVYAIPVLFTLVQAFVLSFIAVPNWAMIFGNVTGTLLYGSAMIAIGMFLSGLTDSQVIAAVTTFFVSMMLMVISSFSSIFDSKIISAVCSALCFADRYTVFTYGVFDTAAAVYFLSVIGLFVYLTVATLEKRRWN
jgi:ABC-2 type transport system permease protein